MTTLVDTVAERRRLALQPAVARAVREAAGVSQQDVAAELGVHRVTIGRWESGRRRPTGEQLRRYAHLIDELKRVSA